MAISKRPPGVRYFYKARSIPVIVFFALLEVGCLIGMLSHPLNIYLWLGAFVAIMLSINLSSLTVAIDDEAVYIVYGIGVFQRTLDIHEIDSLGMRPNNTLHAIYNLAAETALKIESRSGKRLNVGIGDTRAMLEFLQSKTRG